MSNGSIPLYAKEVPPNRERSSAAAEFVCSLILYKQVQAGRFLLGDGTDRLQGRLTWVAELDIIPLNTPSETLLPEETTKIWQETL
jgi:hypothetical protein